MADEYHEKVIREGPISWNDWKAQNPNIRPSLRCAILTKLDLTAANLVDADLRGVDFIAADLSGARLNHADLIGADLSQANLVRADLDGAKLIGASLRGTNLKWATLRGVDLSDADLMGAQLTGANLTGANFGKNANSGANLRYANLAGAVLNDTQLSWANFSNANLDAAKLSRANLSHADFDRADLSLANLSGSNLSYANLNRARLLVSNLIDANLVGANLSWANLSNANLNCVNLQGANLKQATLNETNLDGADLSRVIIGRTIFGNNDLSTVRGLETIQHTGPSTLGVDTLYKSDSKIPEVFLRGVGLPEDFITYLPSLIARPIEFYSCFISYSHADKSFARRLHDTLQGRGIRCWLDEHELLPGDKIYTEVDRGIRLWDKVLLCCSRDSLKSWWVDNEIKIAFDKERHLWEQRGKEVLALIPLNLDDYLFSGNWQSGLATEVKARLAANFIGWEQDNTRYEDQFERLVRALRTDSGRKEPPPQPKL